MWCNTYFVGPFGASILTIILWTFYYMYLHAIECACARLHAKACSAHEWEYKGWDPGEHHVGPAGQHGQLAPHLVHYKGPSI